MTSFQGNSRQQGGGADSGGDPVDHGAERLRLACCCGAAARRRENGLSSLWHRLNQFIKRGCRVHVVPATWKWHPCRIRGAGARRGVESPVTEIRQERKSTRGHTPAWPFGAGSRVYTVDNHLARRQSDG